MDSRGSCSEDPSETAGHRGGDAGVLLPLAPMLPASLSRAPALPLCMLCMLCAPCCSLSSEARELLRRSSAPMAGSFSCDWCCCLLLAVGDALFVPLGLGRQVLGWGGPKPAACQT